MANNSNKRVLSIVSLKHLFIYLIFWYYQATWSQCFIYVYIDTHTHNDEHFIQEWGKQRHQLQKPTWSTQNCNITRLWQEASYSWNKKELSFQDKSPTDLSNRTSVFKYNYLKRKIIRNWFILLKINFRKKNPTVAYTSKALDPRSFIALYFEWQWCEFKLQKSSSNSNPQNILDTKFAQNL